MHPIPYMRLNRALLVVLPAIALAACGTGDGQPRILGSSQGVLVDSAVEGAEFSTATQSGLTSADGEFRYLPGELVTFAVGGIELGTVAGALLLTPVEVTGSPDPGLAAVPNAATKLMRFLQSIDEDANYQNGISISDSTRTMAASLSLDFQTASDAEVDAVIGMLTTNPVVDSETALDNFYETYKSLGGSRTFSWPFPGYPPFPTELLINGGFEAPNTFEVDRGPNVPPGTDVKCGVGFGTFPVPGWRCFNDTYINNTAGPASGPVSHEPGTQSLRQFNQDAGAFQEVPAVPGLPYEASVWAMNWSGDPLKNLGILQLTFRDATGRVLGTFEEFVDSTDDGTNIYLPEQDGAETTDWTQIKVSGTAPPGTAVARLLLIYVPAGAPSAGTIRWDDASLIGEAATPPGDLTLVWRDEFNSDTAPDPDTWTLETGYGNFGWGNDEWQLYTNDPSNISIVYQDPADSSNGYLSISARLNTAQCPSPAPPPGCGKRDGSITSARIKTLPSQPGQGLAFRFGRIEASIKLPVGVGTWPAFWMMGEKLPITGWPKAGEIDIVELFDRGGTSNREALFTLHWCDESLAGGACEPFPTGYDTETSKTDLGVSLGNSFRVYEAEWTANGIVWRVDDVPYFTYAIQPATMEEFLEAFFVLLNVAIGGNPVPPPSATGWPRTMLVDWIRVYQ